MAAFKNKPGCCCSATCLICSDDFNRANENPVSGNWVEKSGDWGITSNVLVPVADGVLLTSCRQGLPIGTKYNYTVQVDLPDGTGPWGIICKWIDASNYDWIELTLSGVDIYPKFWRRTGGVDSLIMDSTTHPAGVPFPTLGQPAVRVTMCYSEVGWTIGSDTTDELWTTCDLTVASALPADATVGFVGFTKGDFDNWEYYYHYLSKTDCHNCDCHCRNPAVSTDYKCIPETLTLTLHPIVTFPDCTATPADIVLTMRQSLPNEADPPPPAFTKSPRKRYWFSDVLDCTDWFADNWFRLDCIGNGVFRLHVLDYPSGATTGVAGSTVLHWVEDETSTYIENDSVACTPIVLHFQTLRVTYHQSVPGGPFLCVPLTAADYECTVSE